MFAVLVITVLVELLLQHPLMESQGINVHLVTFALRVHRTLQLVLRVHSILFFQLQMIPSVFSAAVDTTVKGMVFLVLVDHVMQVTIALKVLPRLPLVMGSLVELVLWDIFAQLNPVHQYHVLKENSLMRHFHQFATCAQQGHIVLEKELLSRQHVQLVMSVH